MKDAGNDKNDNTKTENQPEHQPQETNKQAGNEPDA